MKRRQHRRVGLLGRLGGEQALLDRLGRRSEGLAVELGQLGHAVAQLRQRGVVRLQLQRHLRLGFAQVAVALAQPQALLVDLGEAPRILLVVRGQALQRLLAPEQRVLCKLLLLLQLGQVVRVRRLRRRFLKRVAVRGVARVDVRQSRLERAHLALALADGRVQVVAGPLQFGALLRRLDQIKGLRLRLLVADAELGRLDQNVVLGGERVRVVFPFPKFHLRLVPVLVGMPQLSRLHRRVHANLPLPFRHAQRELLLPILEREDHVGALPERFAQTAQLEPGHVRGHERLRLLGLFLDEGLFRRRVLQLHLLDARARCLLVVDGVFAAALRRAELVRQPPRLPDQHLAFFALHHERSLQFQNLRRQMVLLLVRPLA
mmetsp:Transcript_22966/g.77592  ORF Transcript_22966/g.77592 Transcript_22966/m.77592 type:complete len:376 (+) Transcript_22966:131-1258(+)